MAAPTRKQKRALVQTLRELLQTRVWPNFEPVTDEQAITIRAMLSLIYERQARGLQPQQHTVSAMTLE